MQGCAIPVLAWVGCADQSMPCKQKCKKKRTTDIGDYRLKAPAMRSSPKVVVAFLDC